MDGGVSGNACHDYRANRRDETPVHAECSVEGPPLLER